MKHITIFGLAALIVLALLVAGFRASASPWEYGVYSTNFDLGRYRWRTEGRHMSDAEPRRLWQRMGLLAVEPDPELADHPDVINFLTGQGWEPVALDETTRGVTYVFRRPRN